jgi:radical SAM protein with 4Fe4S-binding SPASM domain
VLALIEWCRKNDVMLETLEAQPLGRANANSHLLLTADDLPMDAKIYRAKENLEDEYEDRHERKGRFFAGFLQVGYQYASLTGRCKGSRAIAYVSSDGTLYPCSNCAGEGILSAGNVTHTSFEQLWHEGFSEMRSICWKDFQECMDCELSISPYYCGSRCPALSYVKTGEFLKPGCSPYMRGAVLQRTRIHDKMHAAQEKISFRSKK